MPIDSLGGNINSRFAIYDKMNFIKCNVATIVIGMATFSLNADAIKRCSLPNSKIMIRQPLGAYESQANDIEVSTKQI